MAAPTTARSGKLIVYLEDPSNPGVWVAPCAMNSKQINQSASANEDIITDCSDPDAPANVARTIASFSRSVSQDGYLAMESRELWQTWFDSGDSWNIRVMLDLPGASGGGYFQGAAVLTAYNWSADQGTRVKASVSIESDGAWSWTDNA